MVDRGKVNYLDARNLRDIAFDRGLNASLKRHGRHAAIATRTHKLEFNNMVVADLDDLHITTIGFQIGAN